jgi:hypothetical protein
MAHFQSLSNEFAMRGGEIAFPIAPIHPQLPPIRSGEIRGKFVGHVSDAVMLPPIASGVIGRAADHV